MIRVYRKPMCICACLMLTGTICTTFMMALVVIEYILHSMGWDVAMWVIRRNIWISDCIFIGAILLLDILQIRTVLLILFERNHKRRYKKQAVMLLAMNTGVMIMGLTMMKYQPNVDGSLSFVTNMIPIVFSGVLLKISFLHVAERHDQELTRKIRLEQRQDRIRGSLIGGAVGDALGYTVEFWQEKEIFSHFGAQGITEYQLIDGKARISDDTQMTLFTAGGVLNAKTSGCIGASAGDPVVFTAGAYQDWLRTQQSDFITVTTQARLAGTNGATWLREVPELYAQRAPGNTCLSALKQRATEPLTNDYIARPINNSKGCGGIIRTVPLALTLLPGENIMVPLESLDRIAAQLAAITHSHPLGYMPSAVLNHILSRILTTNGALPLKDIIVEARNTAAELFAADPNTPTLLEIIDQAVMRADNDEEDLSNIHALGEGWVAEETLAIAIYCALKYHNDFDQAIITAVNHNGDSDSTGAVTGNILGAWIGSEAISDKWKRDLELYNVILEIADDLSRECPLNSDTTTNDPAWEMKYVMGWGSPADADGYDDQKKQV